MGSSLKTFGRRFDGNALRRLREQAGLNERELAAKVFGWAHPSAEKIIRLEEGRNTPYIITVCVLCKIFACSVDVLAPKVNQPLPKPEAPSEAGVKRARYFQRGRA